MEEKGLIKKGETGLSTVSRSGESSLAVVQAADQAKKIRDCTVEEIKQAIRYIIVLLGLQERDIPTDEDEKIILIEFIYTEYGNKYSVEDLRTAFRHAIAGRLNVDREIYGKRFSPNFIARFMDAYDIYKNNLLRLTRQKELIAQQEAELVERNRPRGVDKSTEEIIKEIHYNINKASSLNDSQQRMTPVQKRGISQGDWLVALKEALPEMDDQVLLSMHKDSKDKDQEVYGLTTGELERRRKLPS